MKGAIPRSFVNSVNGIFPDATGNIELTSPVTSVNGETGTITVKYLYTPTANATIFLQEESDNYLHFITRGPNYGQTASNAQLFIDKNIGCLNWSWKNKTEGSQEIYSQIYDSNHQPPYPVTSVNGSGGDVKVTAVRHSEAPTVNGLSVSGGNDGTNFVALTDANGTLVQILRTGAKSTVGKINELSVVAPDWTNAHTIITNGRLNFTLTDGTLYITWNNTDYGG